MEAKARCTASTRDLLPTLHVDVQRQVPRADAAQCLRPSDHRALQEQPAGSDDSFGRNELTVHLHNGHTASESDGFAHDFFGPGLFKDNHYANTYAGIDEFGGIGDPREAMHTFWFHDHRAAFTANNNYLGLNGMYIVYDAADPGHEFPHPGSLRLPCYYGVTDIPLILTDKRFCAAANGRNEAFQVVGGGAPGGDKWIVNGKIQPKMTVRRRKYRFRILNTGPAKAWCSASSRPDGTQGTMKVVAVDANFLEAPFDLTTGAPLNIQVAMRFDVIIDFSAFPAGSSVYLRENAVAERRRRDARSGARASDRQRPDAVRRREPRVVVPAGHAGRCPASSARCRTRSCRTPRSHWPSRWSTAGS